MKVEKFILFGLFLVCFYEISAQRTILDDKYMPLYRKMRLLTLKLAGDVDLNGVQKGGVSLGFQLFCVFVIKLKCFLLLKIVHFSEFKEIIERKN